MKYIMRISHIYKYFFILAVAILIYPTISVATTQTTETDFEDDLAVTETKVNYSKVEGYGYISCIGKIQNKSNVKYDELVFEVQFFNSNNELIDTITEYNYDLVVPADDEIAFRVKGGADKDKSEYQNHQVKITSARPIVPYTSKKSFTNNTIVKILISWGPMLLLIAVWIFFMKKQQGKGSPQKKIIEIQEKQCLLVEEQNKLFQQLIEVIDKKNRE